MQVPFDDAFRACLQVDAEFFDHMARETTGRADGLWPAYEARIQATLAQLGWPYGDYSAAEEAFYAAMLG